MSLTSSSDPETIVAIATGHTIAMLGLIQRAERERDQARVTVTTLDRLVAEFCAAVGEPVPVDAIARARELREAADREAP